MTTPGNLKRRLVLEAPSETEDGAGGLTRVFETVTKLWAQVLPVSAHPDVNADSLGATLRYRIVIRKGVEVTTHHRFRDDQHIFRVIATQESPDRRFLEIDAEVRED